MCSVRVVSGDERFQPCKEFLILLENPILFSLKLLVIPHIGANPGVGVAVEIPGPALGAGVWTLEHRWNVFFVLR